MDLSSLSAKEEPQALTLVNPINGLPLVGAVGDGEETPIIWYAFGSDSHTYRDCRRRITNRDAARTSAAGVAKTQRVENLEANGVALLAAVTTGWSQNLTDNDVSPEFNKANAEALLEKYPWLQQQVDAFVHDRSEHLGN